MIMRPRNRSGPPQEREQEQASGAFGAILRVGEGFDWIQVRRAISRIQTEADADGGTYDEAGEGPAEGEDDVRLEPVGNQVAEDDAENDAEDAAGFGNEDGFGEELAEDVAAAGAD